MGIGRFFKKIVLAPVKLGDKGVAKVESVLMRRIIMMLIRRALLIAGVAGTTIGDNEVTQIVSALTALVSILWSAFQHVQAARKGEGK